ncbi:MAG: molybdopterin converting factor subunit 1 [Cytophagaceae bacterium]|nr:molybdopterin converting factor subunit 1 [Cytophagaceae bacterium]
MAHPLTIALFGITRDIVGASSLTLSIEKSTDVDSLLDQLRAQYPRLTELNSLLVAVNSEYAEGNQLLKKGDEIALIPPVSGG